MFFKISHHIFEEIETGTTKVYKISRDNKVPKNLPPPKKKKKKSNVKGITVLEFKTHYKATELKQFGRSIKVKKG